MTDQERIALGGVSQPAPGCSDMAPTVDCSVRHAPVASTPRSTVTAGSREG